MAYACQIEILKTLACLLLTLNAETALPLDVLWLQMPSTVLLIYCPFKAYLSRDAPTGLTFNNCTLCPHCIYMFCIYLRTNSDLCHLQHKLTGFYNRDEKCLQRGTDWAFK